MNLPLADRFSIRPATNQDCGRIRAAVAAALKPVYTAATAEQAEQQLTEFEARWGARYPMIGRSWRNTWARAIPFFQFPEEIRRVIYTTNAIESLNYSLRKIIKNRVANISDLMRRSTSCSTWP
jgi:putative transposase